MAAERKDAKPSAGTAREAERKVSGNGHGGQAAWMKDPETGHVRRQYVDPEVAGHITEIPPEPRPFSASAPRAGWESGIIFTLFTAIYAVVGYLMLTEGRIVDFVSLQHLNESYMVLWNDPPKLAAIGLDSGTFASIVFMAFSLVKPVATSLVALPAMSALAAGLLLASLNSLMRNCEISLAFRIPLLVLFGLNPLFVFYAANGGPDIIGLFLLVVAMTSLISWSITDQTRHLAAAGLAMGFAILVDYQYILAALGFAIAFTIISAAKKDSDLKIRSTLLLFLTPPVYTLLFWCLINFTLLGDPFAWVTTEQGVIQVNTNGMFDDLTTTFWGSLGDLFEVTLGIAPLALVAAIAVIVGAIMKRDSVGWGLLVVGICLAIAPVIRAVVADQADLVILAYGLPLAVFGLASMAWVSKALNGLGAFALAIMAIGLIAAIPLAWNAMENYRFQWQAQAFTRWIDTRESQEGKSSIGGYTVGINPELSMAEYINNQIPQSKSSVLVDPNFSYGVMITSGRPRQFLDPTDLGESGWDAALEEPFGAVDYMLITTSREGDQIAKRWPTAVEGGTPGLEPVYRTDRYVLIKVAETAPPTNEDDPDDPGANRTEPTPVTPSAPLDPAGPSLTTPSAPQGVTGESGTAPVDPTPTSPSFGGEGDGTRPGPSDSSAPTVVGE